MPAADLRPMSLGEVLDRTFNLYKQNFMLFVGITFLPFLLLFIFQVGMAALQLSQLSGIRAGTPANIPTNAIFGVIVGGLVGAIVGAAAAILAVIIKDNRDQARREKIDEPRRKLLRQMLDNPAYEWRSMGTLSGVIGATPEETARLLIEIGARRDENTDDQQLWGYTKDHPLP